MNDDIGRFPPGHGYEWRGDWRHRLRELLARRGFMCLTDYAAANPISTLEQMTHDLGDGDVAPIQLQWLLVEEATVTGEIEPCARDLLVRVLHEVPGGWPASRDWDAQEDARHALLDWQGCFRDPPYEEALDRIVDALLDASDIPAGWIPAGPDDPHIADAFERYWPKA